MNIEIEIPESISKPLKEKWPDLFSRVREATAVEAYRSGVLTSHQVGELLGHASRWQTESFLKKSRAYLHYTEQDLARDIETLRTARGK